MRLDDGFLDGADLSNAIRHVCGAADVDCAVAFWGVGMRAELFPNWKVGRTRIVCDISMGATCKRALRELGAPRNPDLTVRDGLHAKVYISDRGAVIASANASSRGVGKVAGSGGSLLEAGVFCAVGTAAYVRASAWFDDLFNPEMVVDEADLERAPDRSRELHPEALPEELAELPLLRRLKDHPRSFDGIHIAIASGHLDETMAENSRRDRAAARGEQLGNGRDEVILQNAESDDLRSFAGPLLLFWRLKSVTHVQAFMDCATWPTSHPDTVFGVENWGGFWKALGQTPSPRRLSGKDSELIGAMLAQDDPRWLFNADEFADKLHGIIEPSASDPLMSANEARAVLEEELARFGLGAPSAFTVRKHADMEAGHAGWWRENDYGGMQSDTSRSRAYLRAYHRISGGRLVTAGLPLVDGFLRMDRSVIGRFERDGYLRFVGSPPDLSLEPTTRGRTLLR